MPYCGFLNINKPRGMTSRDVVNRVDALAGRAARSGHAGTLDPMAAGVLVVALGPATRLLSFIQQLPKIYRSTVRLGAVSDTDDAEGDIRPVEPSTAPTLQEITKVLDSLLGSTLQVPPRYSAIKIKGRRAYDYARRGTLLDLSPRPVRIDRIDILSYDWPTLQLEIECGAGTYIRSIARDLGQALGCGGLLAELVRCGVGPFTLEHAVELGNLDAGALPRALRPPLEAILHLPRLLLDPAQVLRVRKGQTLDAERIERAAGSLEAGPYALIDPAGTLVAVADLVPPSLVRPRIILPSSDDLRNVPG
jgi:tRNA pseudouridine55 synthase